MPLRQSHVRACARRGLQPTQQARTRPIHGLAVDWLDATVEGHNLGMAESPAFLTGYMSLLLPSSTGDLEVRSTIRNIVIDALAAAGEWPGPYPGGDRRRVDHGDATLSGPGGVPAGA
jgi:hypothetical protein